MGHVITRNKQIFKKEEYKYYTYAFKTFRQFDYEFRDDAVKCIDCGTYYWDGCEKRCSCNKMWDIFKGV